MDTPPKFHLSPNQQAMLDLALAIDLKVSDPANHPGMMARHQSIESQREAADYILEVENKIHPRRKFNPSARKKAAAVSR